MLISYLIILILSSAVINEKEKSIIYCRLSIQSLLFTSFILYNNLFINPLEKGLGIYGGLFNVSAFTQSFNLFIIIIVSTILILTSFSRNSLRSIVIYIKNMGYTSIFSKNTTNHSLFRNKGENLGLEEDKSLGLEKDTSAMYKIATIIDKTIKKFGQLEIIEYALITVFILCGAIFLMSTMDLISMFLSIELQSYGLYILCTLYRDSESATNSGLTYFLLGGMSSCFILLGSGILYVNSGTTNIENICILNSIMMNNEGPSYYMNISLIIIIVGFLFKVSAAPFHFWSPDVYDGIPTIVTTFVAIVPKISIFVFILQLLINNYFGAGSYTDYSDYLNSSYSGELQITNSGMEIWVSWKDIIITSSLMSLIIGSLLGLTQYRIKRLFAYSTISHVGFILLALAVSTIESIQGYVFYILQYTISNVNAFFILVAIGFISIPLYNNNTANKSIAKSYLVDINNSPVQLISQLKGYFYVNSYISLSLAITLFSFVGIPPLIGFFAKQMVLSAALAEGYVFITLVAVITSVIGAVYYLNIIKNMFFFSYQKRNGNNTHSQAEQARDEFYPLLTGSTKEQNDISNNIKSELSIRPELNLIDAYYNTNTKMNSALSTFIAILTIIILTFIFMPNEWLRVASILSITLFKI